VSGSVVSVDVPALDIFTRFLIPRSPREECNDQVTSSRVGPTGFEAVTLVALRLRFGLETEVGGDH
jgi:hypothetical protein